MKKAQDIKAGDMLLIREGILVVLGSSVSKTDDMVECYVMKKAIGEPAVMQVFRLQGRVQKYCVVDGASFEQA
jgi:hypothetical protein